MPLLFSYGTLQDEAVQLFTFGRLLEGREDELRGFELVLVKIEDAQAAASGTTHHADVVFNGRADSRVAGTVFEVTDGELAAADRYEQLANYSRVAAALASRRQAWMYIDARSALPANSVGSPATDAQALPDDHDGLDDRSAESTGCFVAIFRERRDRPWRRAVGAVNAGNATIRRGAGGQSPRCHIRRGVAVTRAWPSRGSGFSTSSDSSRLSSGT